MAVNGDSITHFYDSSIHYSLFRVYLGYLKCNFGYFLELLAKNSEKIKGFLRVVPLAISSNGEFQSLELRVFDCFQYITIQIKTKRCQVAKNAKRKTE